MIIDGASVRRRGLFAGGVMLAMVAGLWLLADVLPMRAADAALRGWLAGLGVWGPAAMVLIYLSATILLAPGAPLTVAAGAVFGLWWGTAAVSVGSTLGAAVAFLMARHWGRARAARFAARYPRLAALDGALAEGGWRLIFLLRLSPILPFAPVNYLYGLTSIRFWPYLTASWLGMLPGTIMYVYIGHAARAGAVSDSPTGLVMTALGLVATVVATVWITRTTNRALRRHAIAPAAVAKEPPPNRRHRAAWLAVAALSLATGVAAQVWEADIQTAIARRFGPPAITASEAWADAPGSATVDHSRLDHLLRTHVDAHGRVDYAALARDPAELDAYIASLADVPADQLARDDRLALYINAYNAFTLRLILDHYPIASIKDIPAADSWDAVRWRLAGQTISLNDLEHHIIRPHVIEPRIHFALVCAAVGCPPLRAEAYTADRLEAQLADQAHIVHSHDRWLQYDPAANRLRLTALYLWYADDFLAVAPSIPAYAARYTPALPADAEPTIDYLPYDWSLNDRPTAPELH